LEKYKKRDQLSIEKCPECGSSNLVTDYVPVKLLVAIAVLSCLSQ